MQVAGFSAILAGYRHSRPKTRLIFVYFLLRERSQEYVSCSLTA